MEIRSTKQMTQSLIPTKQPTLYDCDFLLWTEEMIAYLQTSEFITLQYELAAA
jgi:hypothetical protein